MSKEYDAGSLKSQAFYSNINSYGTNGSLVSIVAPVPVSFLPEIFSKVTPHPLPLWMLPKKSEYNTGNTDQCKPYLCISGQKEKCGPY